MTRAQRQEIAALQAEVDSLNAQITQLQAQATKDAATIATLKAQLADVQSQLADANSRIMQKDARITALEDQLAAANARIAELEAVANPTEPAWTEVLRDTDGVSLKSALAQMRAGDLVRLVGEFPVASEFHFPGSDMTLGCRPGEARLVATAAMEDMVGIKSGPGTGAKNTKLLNLEIDAAWKADNGVSAWIGTATDGVRVLRSNMTGAHCNGQGINLDFGIHFKDSDFSGNGSTAEVGHGASGTKMFNVHGVTYTRCKANGCVGNGYWSDYGCGRVEYIDCDGNNNTRRGFFREKCGRYGNPYPTSFVFGEYVDDFIRKGGKVVYDGMLTIDGGSAQGNGVEGVLIVNSPHARVGGMTLGGNGGRVGIRTYNDPDRMYPLCAGKTNPGWMSEDIIINKSSCTLNGDTVTVSNVPVGKATIT